MNPFKRSSDAHTTRMRAVEYASHGWPVAPLAVPHHGHCPCERGTCVSPHLADIDIVSEGSQLGVTDTGDVARIWQRPWSIALVASEFDIVELPSNLGAPLNHKLLTTCPTATAPRGRRWYFVMETGSIDRELVTAAGGRLHSGPGAWVPASPTWTEDTGRVGWVVEPHMTRWQPYRRLDLIDMVFGRIESPITPGLPGVLTEGS